METNRRGFLKAMLALGVAPAVVGSGILMPVRKVLAATPAEVAFVESGTGFTQAAYAAVLHGDGIRDDTAGLQAFLNGLPVLYQGRVVQDRIGYGKFLVANTIHVTEQTSGRLIHDSQIIGAGQEGPLFYYHDSAFPHGGNIKDSYLFNGHWSQK